MTAGAVGNEQGDEKKQEGGGEIWQDIREASVADEDVIETV